MGHNKSRDARALVHALQAEHQAIADARNVIMAWNERLADKRLVLFSPTLRAALISKQHWLSVYCPSCETVADVDLTVMRRSPDTTIHEILPSLRCRRCPGGPSPTPVRLKGPQGTIRPPIEADPVEVENARRMAEALTEIAHHGVGPNPIWSVHEMAGIAERALNYVGIEWQKRINGGNDDQTG